MPPVFENDYLIGSKIMIDLGSTFDPHKITGLYLTLIICQGFFAHCRMLLSLKKIDSPKLELCLNPADTKTFFFYCSVAFISVGQEKKAKHANSWTKKCSLYHTLQQAKGGYTRNQILHRGTMSSVGSLADSVTVFTWWDFLSVHVLWV